MEFPTNVILEWYAQFFWPLTRISAMLMTVSFFGAKFVSPRIRLYLSFAVTLAVMPMLPKVPTHIEIVSISGVILLAQQIIIGVAVGTVTQFVAQTFVMLGQIVGMQSSLGFASMVDPANGQNTPLLGQFYLFLVTMLFLATDGHLEVLQLIIFSFKTLPIGESFNAIDYQHMASWFSTMFNVAFGMAIAAVIALLTVNISFGVMTRAAPQLNIFSLGFAFALVVGLFLTYYLLNGVLPQYTAHWQTGVESICGLIRLNCSQGGL